MSNYYYFASSLPSLYMDKEAPITYKEFMKRAKDQMSAKDYSDLEEITFRPSGEKARLPIVKEWESLVYRINEILTEERAKKLGIDDKEYKARCLPDKAIEDRVKHILSIADPLEAEREILNLYFDFLSSHETSDPFSTKALMIYSLKLQIKEKASGFDKDRGKAEFDRLFSDVKKDIFHKE